MDNQVVQGLAWVAAVFIGLSLLGFLIVVFTRFFEAVRYLKIIAENAERQTAMLRQSGGVKAA